MTDLSIIPFGGVRENGKNMYAVTVNDEIFILDAGLKYPETDQLGVDVVVPDFEYLIKNTEKIAGVFLSHGHADAIGALPYFLQQVNVPIFGSELTIELAKLAIKDQPALKDYNDYHIINEKSEIDFGNVKVSFFNTTHSIPESLGIVIGTEYGQVVYTGDFKFDQTAESYYRTDIPRLVEVGQRKVLALLADAAGTEGGADSVNESKIGDYILETFRDNKKKRIIVAAVASNIQRIQQIIDATAATKRKLVLSGNDIENVVRTAIKLKKLQLPLPESQLFVSLKNMKSLVAHETVILETGRMGEPIKHLNRMANGEDAHIKIGSDDLVFITTTPSTAMESVVAKTRDMIFKQGADVKQISTDMRSSGHASRNDLQMMLNIMQPAYFMPIQGEYRVMSAAKDAAEEVNLPEDHILMAMKGDQFKLIDGQFELKDSFAIGETLIDGSGIGDIGNVVLRDRRILSEDGVFVSVVTIDRKKRQVVSKPKLTSRGFVYVKANRDLMKEASDLTVKQIEDYLTNNKSFDWNELKAGVRDVLSRFLFEQTRRRPMVMPVVMEVNQNRRPNNHKTTPTQSGAQASKKPAQKKLATPNSNKKKVRRPAKKNVQSKTTE
ncbi:ribonuclease J [Leuconostoc mesenteroides]|jgi:ribonuclease J|uniref:RNase J family beta-CASP ribonuclease n=2 Tax=Leuconostoc mesenteroides TaxID=1245 RepID=A0A843Z272_LEUME|nr:ribonuclease J [Leuconostoc mesenteroides]ABJ61738.1 Predicted hydrolase of the metallo-beta-lactamase superfamily [Leuconostoc mesenteroides subsp. mesenteroides ATCC 8293]ARN63095.1 RNase J family beta-CASP ribonuclease [Leuconostoc mesenteroides subsp. mesenteroides]MBZ1513884.1 ribonuclease J [Leuconostoc mesenteroides]MBZ1518745.1 ribonuclease J [Leuconostoc mesenteroides]MBZ1519983.1 ribonuclease J [Leuconostoc mesenteroides]